MSAMCDRLRKPNSTLNTPKKLNSFIRRIQWRADYNDNMPDCYCIESDDINPDDLVAEQIRAIDQYRGKL